ncbi:hypothetical protein Y032_0004g1927 [Ancylostoma ceylanicum]|uniref:Uncharacterized protein n=1 Tax=Ancylostoma ceylanicum TaxID=53326 RepID=A0A016VWF6_9BILA|nr:hypothetical protein Y032_0004g1927 [Ancylostoma ceylanicum]
MLPDYTVFHTTHYMYSALEHASHTKSIALNGVADTGMVTLISVSAAISPQVGGYSWCSTYRCDLLASRLHVKGSSSRNPRLGAEVWVVK